MPSDLRVRPNGCSEPVVSAQHPSLVQQGKKVASIETINHKNATHFFIRVAKVTIQLLSCMSGLFITEIKNGSTKRNVNKKGPGNYVPDRL